MVLKELVPEEVFPDAIAAIRELNKDNFYIVELNAAIPLDVIKNIMKVAQDYFKAHGVDVLFVLEGTIANIYKLERGEAYDSSASN